ncbi:MAG TPA: hypothetical protein VGX76_07275, partial [Pirellulales bacterium]|nr:hypothetical protein [Pirellulales bacterium]
TNKEQSNQPTKGYIMADPISPPVSESTDAAVPNPPVPPLSPPPASSPAAVVGDSVFKRNLHLVGPTLTLLVALVTFFATLYVANVRTQEKLDGLQTNLDNIINRQNEEINKLRDEAANLKNVIAQNVGNANLTNGRFETLLNAHTSDLGTLKAEVGTLGKAAAKLDSLTCQQGADVAQLKNQRLEKIAADLTLVRERLAALESGAATRKEK